MFGINIKRIINTVKTIVMLTVALLFFMQGLWYHSLKKRQDRYIYTLEQENRHKNQIIDTLLKRTKTCKTNYPKNRTGENTLLTQLIK